MADAAVRIGTEAANILLTKFRPFYHIAALEEQIVTKNFDDGNARIGGKMGNILTIHKLSRKTVQTLTTTDADQTGAGLTYNTNTETAVTATAVTRYSAIELPLPLLNQVVSGDALKSGYLELMMGALATQLDVDGASEAQDITTNILGGAGQHITGALLRSALGAILVSGRGKARAGKAKYFCYHSTEHEHVLAIPEITAADVRGDGTSPNVGGYVWKAYDLTLNHSGNIFTSGGLTYNFLHLKEAFVEAFNEKIHDLPPQADGMIMRFIASAEYAHQTVEEAEAVLINTD